MTNDELEVEKDEREVTYLDQYGDNRPAIVTDPDYDPANLWEGTDYAARDTRADLPVSLRWDEAKGWMQRVWL